MAKQTFTAGQVLTAAEMNSLQENDYNWTVTTKTASYTLAAGDEGTRIVMNNAGATTITVDDAVFAAGDVVWIHNIGAGTCTVTAGTATVNTAGELALAQWEGGSLYFTSASSAIFFRGGGAGLEVFEVEYLVVGGGGAGGVGGLGFNGGGGGGGGYITNRSGEQSGGASTPNPALYLPLGSAIYCKVGAGGASGAYGSQSYLHDLWAIGGGVGRGSSQPASYDGTAASGGGGGEPSEAARTGIARQGKNGGAGTGADKGSGGGGAGVNGVQGGAGGNGIASSITGSSTYRAGGGGGAFTPGYPGGLGGGGAGGTVSVASGTAGTANTGGGGGGGGKYPPGTGPGGAGGSGIVILRWLTADATATVGGGLTSSSTTSGDYTILTITAGTDTITWN